MQPRAPVRCAIHRLGLTDYAEALEVQRRAVDACRSDGLARLLLLEHPPTYTLGVRAASEHVLASPSQLGELGASLYQSDRGGDVTFHGPGQLVGYPILDLRNWGQGPVWYVRSLEETLVRALAEFDIQGKRRAGFPGVWVADAKIASIGVHVSRGITSHGFALNVDPDLRYFSHIVPCGISGIEVTSMAMLGAHPHMTQVLDAVERAFADVFGVYLEDPVPAVGVARAS